MLTPYSLDDYVTEVKEYMYKNSITKPHVVAHSFGGRIALKAQSNEDLFCKMVLVGCAGLKPRFSIKKTVKRTAFKLLKNIVPKRKLAFCYSTEYNALSPIMKRSFCLVTGETLDNCLEKITNDALIVFGKNDKQTPLYMARRLNRGLVNGKLVVLENAGHFCFVDRPLKFNTEVKEFLLS